MKKIREVRKVGLVLSKAIAYLYISHKDRQTEEPLTLNKLKIRERGEEEQNFDEILQLKYLVSFLNTSSSHTAGYILRDSIQLFFNTAFQTEIRSVYRVYKVNPTLLKQIENNSMDFMDWFSL